MHKAAGKGRRASFPTASVCPGVGAAVHNVSGTRHHMGERPTSTERVGQHNIAGVNGTPRLTFWFNTEVMVRELGGPKHIPNV